MKSQNYYIKKTKKSTVTLFMCMLIVVMAFPFYVILTNSFKTLRQFYESPITLPQDFYLDNYKFVIENLSYFNNLANNIIVVVLSLITIIAFASMAGFIIAKKPNWATKAIYTFFVLGITLPTFTMLIPQVKLINDLGLKNNYLALVFLYCAGGMPTALFLFTGFFSSMPQEVEDAARIDGCNMAQMYWHIHFPLSKSTAATVILLQTIAIWNDTVMPDLVMTNDKMKTLMPALQTFYGRMLGQGTRWEYIYAFVVLCIIPLVLLYAIVSKRLIQGVIDGALKG